jgi:hypothetical protein
MKDGRDRFLYNYMVFAKKKYSDDWKIKFYKQVEIILNLMRHGQMIILK